MAPAEGVKAPAAHWTAGLGGEVMRGTGCGCHSGVAVLEEPAVETELDLALSLSLSPSPASMTTTMQSHRASEGGEAIWGI